MENNSYIPPIQGVPVTPEISTDQLPVFKPKLSSFKKKAIIFAILLVVLLFGTVATLYLSSKEQDIRGRASYVGPKLSMVPSVIETNTNAESSIGVILNTNDDTVSAAEIHLSYNPQVLEIISFSANESMPVILSPEKHSNGESIVIIGVKPEKPLKGTKTIGTFKIKRLSKQDTEIKLDKSLVASIGKNTNSLTSSTGTNIKALTTIDSELTTTPSLSNTNAQPTITTSSLPVGQIQRLYAAEIVGTDTNTNNNLDINIEGLPLGIYKNNCQETAEGGKVSCTISGTPLKSGDFVLNVKITDGFGGEASKKLNLIIN